MPVRTTDAAVKGLMQPGGDYDLRRNPSLTPFITLANIVTDRLATTTAEYEAPYALDATSAEMVERCLSAHFYQHSDRAWQSKSTAGASGSFAMPAGQEDLTTTSYGRMAMAADPTGMLPSVINISTNKTEVGGFWLGTEDDE